MAMAMTAATNPENLKIDFTIEPFQSAAGRFRLSAKVLIEPPTCGFNPQKAVNAGIAPPAG
jgi:hypothetical protein